MNRLEDIKKKLVEIKPILREKYKVKEIGIFGSYVKGRQRKRSDIDILVDFEEVPDLFTFVETEEFISKKKVICELKFNSVKVAIYRKVLIQMDHLCMKMLLTSNLRKLP
jgi:predicted nucleotidyltransferase